MTLSEGAGGRRPALVFVKNERSERAYSMAFLPFWGFYVRRSTSSGTLNIFRLRASLKTCFFGARRVFVLPCSSRRQRQACCHVLSRFDEFRRAAFGSWSWFWHRRHDGFCFSRWRMSGPVLWCQILCCACGAGGRWQVFASPGSGQPAAAAAAIWACGQITSWRNVQIRRGQPVAAGKPGRPPDGHSGALSKPG